MSQADIETLKAGFEAYDDGDIERMLEVWDEDAELVRLGGSEAPAREGGDQGLAGPRSDRPARRAS